MKKYWLWIFITFFFSSVGASAASLSQEKETQQKKQTEKGQRSRVARPGERIVISDEKGAKTVIQESQKQKDFVLETKKYVNLQVEVLEIRPSKTILISSPKLTVEDGKPGTIRQGTLTSSIAITIVPSIVEGKGIDCKIEFLKSPEMAEKKGESVLLKNGESAVMELFENKAKESKLAIKLTPLIEVVEAAKEFPGGINQLRLTDSFLLLNEDKLIARGNLNAASDSDDIYLFFNSGDKGFFVLSFKPFAGAEPRGVVEGKILQIKFGDDEFEWVCHDPILPEGSWLVWVRHNPSLQKIVVEKASAILGKNGLIGIGTGKDSWKRFFEPGRDK
jgi:hypothetical protein